MHFTKAVAVAAMLSTGFAGVAQTNLGADCGCPAVGSRTTVNVTSLPGASDINREIIVVASSAFTGGTLGTKAIGQILNPASVTYTSSSVLNFALSGTTTGTPTVDVFVNVRKTTPTENSKTLRKSRYVKIDTASHPTGATGTYGLGYYDVYEIENVWSANTTESYPTSDPTALNTWTDVTTSFTLNDGQKDGYYDLSSMTTT